MGKPQQSTIQIKTQQQTHLHSPLSTHTVSLPLSSPASEMGASPSKPSPGKQKTMASPSDTPVRPDLLEFDEESAPRTIRFTTTPRLIAKIDDATEDIIVVTRMLTVFFYVMSSWSNLALSLSICFLLFALAVPRPLRLSFYSAHSLGIGKANACPPTL